MALSRAKLCSFALSSFIMKKVHVYLTEVTNITADLHDTCLRKTAVPSRDATIRLITNGGK
jgi:hypothetical protein